MIDANTPLQGLDKDTQIQILEMRIEQLRRDMIKAIEIAVHQPKVDIDKLYALHYESIKTPPPEEVPFINTLGENIVDKIGSCLI